MKPGERMRSEQHWAGIQQTEGKATGLASAGCPSSRASEATGSFPQFHKVSRRGVVQLRRNIMSEGPTVFETLPGRHQRERQGDIFDPEKKGKPHGPPHTGERIGPVEQADLRAH